MQYLFIIRVESPIYTKYTDAYIVRVHYKNYILYYTKKLNLEYRIGMTHLHHRISSSW